MRALILYVKSQSCMLSVEAAMAARLLSSTADQVIRVNNSSTRNNHGVTAASRAQSHQMNTQTTAKATNNTTMQHARTSAGGAVHSRHHGENGQARAGAASGGKQASRPLDAAGACTDNLTCAHSFCR